MDWPVIEPVDPSGQTGECQPQPSINHKHTSVFKARPELHMFGAGHSNQYGLTLDVRLANLGNLNGAKCSLLLVKCNWVRCSEVE
jgi:hypothetical protein